MRIILASYNELRSVFSSYISRKDFKIDVNSLRLWQTPPVKSSVELLNYKLNEREAIQIV